MATGNVSDDDHAASPTHSLESSRVEFNSRKSMGSNADEDQATPYLRAYLRSLTCKVNELQAAANGEDDDDENDFHRTTPRCGHLRSHNRRFRGTKKLCRIISLQLVPELNVNIAKLHGLKIHYRGLPLLPGDI